MKKRATISGISLGFIALLAPPELAEQKPDILILWGDDIGYWNVSAYNQGMMGYKTPNIDRIAQEGVRIPTSTIPRSIL